MGNWAGRDSSRGRSRRHPGSRRPHPWRCGGTETITALGLKAAPVAETLLQQGESAHHIGLNEGPWPIDGPVHVALGGKMHDHVRRVTLNDLPHARRIRDIAALESVTGIAGDRSERIQVPGIGERVHHQNLVGCFPNEATDHG
jgi:hypothetical protein